MNIFSKINNKLKESMVFLIVFFFVLSFTCTTLYKSIQNDLNKQVPVKTETLKEVKAK